MDHEASWLRDMPCELVVVAGGVAAVKGLDVPVVNAWLMGIAWLVVDRVVGVVMGWCFTVFYLALTYLDLPMERRRWAMREKLGWMRKRLRTTLGFGAASQLLLLVPVVQLLLIPASVAGATLLFREGEGLDGATKDLS